MKLPLAMAFNSACTACTINTSAAPSSPVAIALPVPSHIVDIFTLFSCSNFLLKTSSSPVSQVEVVVAKRIWAGEGLVVVGFVVVGSVVVGVAIFSVGACWTQPAKSDIKTETNNIFANRFFILLPPYVYSNITHINKSFEKVYI